MSKTFLLAISAGILAGAYEAGKPKQHLVGMTPGWDRGKRQPREWIYGSPADWIQIGGGAGPADEFATGGSATYTDKLLFLDTDHTPWHTQNNADAKSIQKWVWKTFTRGHHPLMLEMYRHGDAMHPDLLSFAYSTRGGRASGQPCTNGY